MTTTIATMRAVAYLRVSTAGQEEGYGLDVQRERIEEYTRDHGIEIIESVEETSGAGIRSGEEFSWEHRPVLLDIRERIPQGDFDVIIVARYDRLSRDFATLIALERRAEKHKVKIISVAEEFGNGDTAVGRFIRKQMAIIAELERDLIADRTQAGKAQARKKGRRAAGAIPHGYRKEGRTLALDEPEPTPPAPNETPEREQARKAADKRAKERSPAGTVRRIYELAARGATTVDIARHLAGAPTPRRGKTWSRQVILDIVRNPVYTGEMHSKKNAHPAIISKRLWNQAQAALEARRRTR